MRERIAGILALIEGSLILAAMEGLAFVWRQPRLSSEFDLPMILGQAGIAALCCLTAFYYNGLYDLRIVRGFSKFTARLAPSFCWAFILLVAVRLIFPDTMMAGDLFVSSVLPLLVVGGLVIPLRAAFYTAIRSRRFINRVLIVGATPLTEQLIHEIGAQPHAGYTVIGVVDDSVEHPGERHVSYPLFGPLQYLSRIIANTRPDRIIVAMADRRKLPAGRLVEWPARGVIVEDGADVYERLTGKLAIESLTPMELVFSQDFHKSTWLMGARRAFSVAAAACGLILAAPLMAMIALAIALESNGPVLFIQERVGLMGRTFRLLKFRTMHPAHGNTSEWAGDNGGRITRIGKWLRKFRLDELPQFVNILRGDMDLVGPRPHPASNRDLFVMALRNAPECGEVIPYYALRSVVRPGITGWAQVRYRYANDLDEEIEKAKYDLYYIKHLSIWLDLRILLDTVRTALLGRESHVSPPCEIEGSRGKKGDVARAPREMFSMRGHSSTDRQYRAVPAGMSRTPSAGMKLEE